MAASRLDSSPLGSRPPGSLTSRLGLQARVHAMRAPTSEVYGQSESEQSGVPTRTATVVLVTSDELCGRERLDAARSDGPQRFNRIDCHKGPASPALALIPHGGHDTSLAPIHTLWKRSRSLALAILSGKYVAVRRCCSLILPTYSWVCRQQIPFLEFIPAAHAEASSADESYLRLYCCFHCTKALWAATSPLIAQGDSAEVPLWNMGMRRTAAGAAASAQTAASRASSGDRSRRAMHIRVRAEHPAARRCMQHARRRSRHRHVQ
eukprot:6210878-Pleurochrysis_carterae.AAC.1